MGGGGKAWKPLRGIWWRVNLWVLNTLEVDGGWQVQSLQMTRGWSLLQTKTYKFKYLQGPGRKKTTHEPGWVLVTGIQKNSLLSSYCYCQTNRTIRQM